MKRLLPALAAVIVGGAVAPPIFAQAVPSVGVPPATVMLPNYNTIPVGEIGSLEGGAYLARVHDGSATWFNPAGLALAEKSSLSGSAGAFQVVSLRPDGNAGSGGSFKQMPAAVGVVVKKPLGLERWTGGFQVTRTHGWELGVDLEQTIASGGATNRASYSSTTAFDGWVGSAGVGYDVNSTLRLGGSIDLQVTQWSARGLVSDQFRGPGGLDVLEVEGHGSAQAAHARVTAGLQCEPAPRLRLGAVIRSPGLRLWAYGSRYQEGVETSGSATTTASLFDPDADADYRLPLEFRGGAAVVGRRAQVEVNLLVHGGSGTYEALRASQPFVVTTDAGNGTPTTVDERQVPPSVIDSLAVVNVAVGGQYQLTENGSWVLHGGFATDRSPVGPSDTAFTKVQMQSWTVGFSGRTSLLLGSFGLRYESGTSDPFTVRRLEDGAAPTTRVKVRNVGIVYSFALRF